MTRSHYATPAAFATVIMLHGGSRRRHGTYYNEEGSEEGECKMKSETEVDAACLRTVANAHPGPSITYAEIAKPLNFDPMRDCSRMIHCCHWCLQCETEACLKTYPHCEEFVASAFEQCDIDDGPPWVTIIIVACVCFAVCSIGVVVYLHWSKRQCAQFIQMKMEREKLLGSKASEVPSRMNFAGTCTETGIESKCKYAIDIYENGTITGVGVDEDGESQLQGIMVQDVDSSKHNIFWKETQRHSQTKVVEMEVQGQMSMLSTSNVQTFEIQAEYVTQAGSVSGHLRLHCQHKCGVVVGTPGSFSAQNEGMVLQGTAMEQHEAPQLDNGRLQNHAVVLQGTPIGKEAPSSLNPTGSLQNHAEPGPAVKLYAFI